MSTVMQRLEMGFREIVVWSRWFESDHSPRLSANGPLSLPTRCLFFLRPQRARRRRCIGMSMNLIA